MKRWFASCDAFCARRGAGWVLLAALAVAYTMGYALHELYPGTGAGALARGWWTWTDQQRYLVQAQGIARGEIDATTYFYPPGYAALGALFVRWMPAHPFFVPNLALILVAATMWWRLARRWLSASGALLVGVVFIGTHRWLIADSMIVPWNTLVTQAALLAGIHVVTAKTGGRAVWWLAGLASASYFVRPADAVAFAPMLVYATWRLPTWRERLMHGIGGAALIVAAWAAVGGLNLAVFGHWRTPYEWTSLKVLGFFGYPTSHKFFWLFLEGLPFFGEVEPGLLWRYPWLFLAVPAAIWWVQRERGAGVAALAAVVLSGGVYLNYNDMLPSGLYRFTLIHYLAWWFPLMFVLAVAACWHGWRSGAVRVGLAVAAVLFVAGAGLRLESQTEKAERVDGAWLLPAKRPLFVHIPGESMETVKQLRIDGRALLEPAEHLTPYMPSDFKVLLGKKATGERLTFAGGAVLAGTPEIGEFGWTWRISGDRVRKTFRRMFLHAWR